MNPDEDLIKAALMEDEEDIRYKKEQEEKSTPEAKPSDEADAPADDEKDSEEAEDSEDAPADKGEDKKPDTTEDKTEEKPEPKSDSEEDSVDKPTRKERREAKRQAYIESIRKEKRQQEQPPQFRQQQLQQNPELQYKPLDYRELDAIEEDKLEQDRRNYGEISRKQGAEQATKSQQYLAEQNDFWKDVEHEAEVLSFDPEFKFLDDKKPDSFDPDKAADLNEKYLEFVGFNPSTGTVQRTDVSYAKFVRREIQERKDYAEEQAAETRQTLEETKANTGIRPGGGSKKSGLGKLKPGDISKMSNEEFEKYEAEIDRQILAELN